jgi:hypothetical protein
VITGLIGNSSALRPGALMASELVLVGSRLRQRVGRLLCTGS